MPKRTPRPPEKGKNAGRDARLAEALRENLRRRKRQAEARSRRREDERGEGN